jgi:NitT/TauT family transport system ATP-binding protein
MITTTGHPPDNVGLRVEQPKIQARGVERRFAGRNATVHALGPFDLDIAEGEFVCLVGPSGCGKSTFLRIVAGLVNPSAGEVTIHRESTSSHTTAMVFQDYSIYPWKTVISNVALGLDLAGVPHQEAQAKARLWLERLGMDSFANAYPAVLSGGMQQRVSIARAFAVEPEILLMDEPFAALDAQLRTVLQEELLELWQAHRRTVVFVTHSLEEAILLGDRVIVMSARPGRLLADYRVTFERPRSTALRAEPAFGELEQRLWHLLRSEVEQPVSRS